MIMLCFEKSWFNNVWYNYVKDVLKVQFILLQVLMAVIAKKKKKKRYNDTKI